MVLMIALVSAFVIGVGLVMAAYVGTTKVPGMLAQRKLMGRLQSLSAPIDEPDAVKAAALVKVSNAGIVPGFDRMMAGTARGSALSRSTSLARSTPSTTFACCAISSTS